jgi:hypothetical protein
MLNTDSHFVIGGEHVLRKTPCQDHALCGMRNDSHLIVISDGCSTGGHTDIGARILTCATIMAFKLCADVGDINPLNQRLPLIMLNQIRIMAQANKNMMGLRSKDLHGTCVYAMISLSGGFIHVLGDGCVILKYSDGSITSYSYEWVENNPCYPIYEGDDLSRFIEIHKKFENGSKALTIKKVSISIDGEEFAESEFVPVEESLNGHVIQVTPEMINNGLECIAICSDGVESFSTVDHEISTTEIIKQVVAFKNTNGDFVKRRMTRLLSDFTKQDFHPSDDFAIAAINLKNTDKENDNIPG